jgi:hypothetical protein
MKTLRITVATKPQALVTPRVEEASRTRALRGFGAFVLYLGGLACAGDSAAGVDTEQDAPFTYAQHIQPILEARCIACHHEQGIGAFSLTNYEQAETWANYASGVIEANLMPPFPPGQDACSPIDDARAMPQEERDMFTRWAADGHPLGDPNAPPEYSITLPSSPLDAPTHRFALDSEYIAPVQVFEEYRCFRVDPKLTNTVVMSALHVDTEQAERFHQARVSVVPPDRLDEVLALEGSDGRPGWPCYHNPGVAGLDTVGQMLPGLPYAPFPAGTATSLQPGTQFIVDAYLHHYTFDPLEFSVVGWESPDSSAVSPTNFVLHDESFVIPAGAESFSSTIEAEVVSADTDPSTLLGGEVREGPVWRVDVHMHQWGRSAKVEVEHPDGTRSCIVDIPSWDPEWQGSYSLSVPVQTIAGDRIVATCEWANREEDQPLVAGVALAPADLGWGLDALHEMCEVRLLFTGG